MKRIPITKLAFGVEEQAAVTAVLRSGWIAQGSRVAEFERLFGEYVGLPCAVATSSGTSALHLALLAAGIGPGDEVLIPAFSFLATANAVEYTGAKPVMIDINLRTFNIDPLLIRHYLENRGKTAPTSPKAILPVSQFGLCADMAEINRIAEDHGLLVIEDAACGLGAQRNGHKAGTEALMGCFSFHPRKLITTGEGGMVVAGDNRLAEKIRALRNHGASVSNLERHLNESGSLLPDFDFLGYNYRMTDIQAALGVVQIGKADSLAASRRSAAGIYDKLLNDLPDITAPFVPPGHRHAYQSYVCLYKLPNAAIHDLDDRNMPDNRGASLDLQEVSRLGNDRNRLMAVLEKAGISVRQGTHAIPTLGYYRKKYGFGESDYSMVYVADRLSIALPLYPGITEGDQKRVVEALRRAT
jgi:dTDP-4-amino-4,6-dideoxygalactose transaminase